MWKNIVEADRPLITVWRMRISCWIPKASNRHSEYVKKDRAIPLHAWTGPEGSRRLRLPDFKTIGT